MAITTGTILNFYYRVDDILDEIMNDSLFLENGGNQDYDVSAVDQQKLPILKRWLKETANDVFVMLHKGSSIVEITAAELTENNATKVFTWDGTIYGQEGNYISYWSKFAVEFDINLMRPVDSAIERALVDITLFKWLKRKGRLTQQASDNKDEARMNVLRLINYRTESKKTYRMY
jgi:hypothetical protein